MFNSKDFPKKGAGTNEYLIFNFCPAYFNGLEPHSVVLGKMKAGTKDKFNTLDMRSQGTNLFPLLLAESGILTLFRFNFPT